ncbi:MAG TPA: hypothetical protein VHV10_03950 [Ktedonobacteraceae bacterium]|jgi:hypothetical protein|nr:hypothetical protein [Ktedonobacteraceae bacterium]
MQCSEPDAIRGEELVAYLEGEKVRPAVEAHLVHCQCCSAQLANYRQIEGKLISKLYRWNCPSNQILGEYHLGLLGKQLAAQVKDHLNICVLCAAEMAILIEFLQTIP